MIFFLLIKKKISTFIENVGKTMCKAAPVSIKGVEKQCGVAYVVSELLEVRQAVAWGDFEKHLPVGMECLAVERKSVDCYALEKHSLYPLDFCHFWKVNKQSPFPLLTMF
jgi:hypothetical protein